MKRELENFFLNQTTNIKTPPVRKAIGDVALFVNGRFNGATIRFEVSPYELTEDPDDMVWFDHPNGIFTDPLDEVNARFWNNADLPAGVWYRMVLENAGAQTELSAFMRPRTGNGNIA